MHFEWDAAKAESNLRKHKVSFATAARVPCSPSTTELKTTSTGFRRSVWLMAASC